MKKAIYNQSGTRQIVDTGYKMFDNQTNCLAVANSIANTMIGFYIRPYTETQCNNIDFPVGHLMEYDLKGYDLSGCPKTILAMIKSPKRREPVKFYQFCVYPPNRPRNVFGYGLCAADDTCLAFGLSTNENFVRYHLRVKKYRAIKEAMQYVSDLTDTTTLVSTGGWEECSEQGKILYDRWVEKK